MTTSPVHLYHHSTMLKTNVDMPIHPFAKPILASSPTESTVSTQALSHHRLHPEFLAKYTLGQELGSGGFGFVVSAYEHATGIERAVKFIFRNKVPSSAWAEDRDMGLIPMEIYILKHVRHDNVIGFVDAYQDERFFYLVMELHGTQWTSATPPLSSSSSSSSSSVPSSIPSPIMHSPTLSHTSDDSQSTFSSSTLDEEPQPRTFVRRTSCDLFECIEQHQRFDESLAKHIFRQIARCVAHLDKLGICHRDIKDENIVIDSDYKVKLIDFGSSVLLPRHYGEHNKTYLFSKFYGTISFASPEILRCEPYRAEPAEVWSLGVLLYTILFGEVPFHNQEMALAGRFVQPKIEVSSKCMHLLSCLLEKSPSRRPTIHQILTHSWLRED
ncbi:kinase-like domain-containing protein [Radiomyces spectabilis]|uniref:kinase-like domain-containing protein n=1 Tax=Radiomyces spectabilis TaxID=64574 RepID=UPI00221E9BFC|nr:kinase-like domain-containing protein [Radiomyces spectabilis]KAI8374625.1 kinase-like domain-containing protein [Radiomyces spectabilis]